MREYLVSLAQTIAASAPHDWSIAALRSVPGLPPILQSIHIVCVAAVVASIVFIHLRVLGLALPSQNLVEMRRRLLPWLWCALPLLFSTALPFVLARPYRYFLNPVFAIKMGSLLLAVFITLGFLRSLQKTKSSSVSLSLKLMSAVSLGLWLLIILAGRWIAYSEYLFPPEY